MMEEKILNFSQRRKEWMVPGILFCVQVLAYTLLMLSVQTSHEKVAPSMVYMGALHTMVHALWFPSVLVLSGILFRSHIVFSLLLSSFYLSLLINLYYYGYFDSFVYLDQFSDWIYLKEIWVQILFQLTGWKELLLIVCWLISGYLGLRFVRQCRRLNPLSKVRPIASFICLGFMFLCMGKFLLMSSRHHPVEVFYHDAVQCAKQFGLLGFYGVQLHVKLQPAEPLPPHPGKINPVNRQNELGINKRLNIIFIQVESLDARVLDVQIDGKPLMKNLNALKKESVYFNFFFAQHRGGRSQDAELSTLYSILPSNERSGFNVLAFDQVTSLMSVLRTDGYYTAGLHANDGNYFNRRELFRKSGANDFLADADFTGRAKGWYSKDYDFLQQSVDRLTTFPEPFFAYLITMQSHGPFKNHDAVSESLAFDEVTPRQRNYFRTMYEVDIAIGNFISQLKSIGLWERCIFILFADHYSGTTYPPGDLYPLADHPPEEHIPLFVVCPGIPPRLSSLGGSHIDLAPTLTHLLNLSEPDGWVGSSLFAERTGRVVLNYPHPIVYRMINNEWGQEEDPNVARPFIRWSEALQK